ncbi:OmpA family protein [Riemerella anatipestifer]|uniref:OmpA family protein n=1 Tax=Riemerella anatipestifer TaxID=34085 RepID=UPI0030EDACD4
MIKGQLGSALISQASSQLGENESGVSKAVSGLLPAVVGGLANNASNSTVLDAISGASSSGLLGNLLGSTTSNNSLITTVLSAIFGDKVGGVVNSIASFAGISSSSVTSLLNLVTGATLGSVGKYAMENNMDRSGITSLLSEQKSVVSSLLPAGLSLGALGLGNMFGETVGADTSKVNVSSYSAPKVEVNKGDGGTVNLGSEDNKGGSSFWKWLLPLLVLGLLGLFLWKQCKKGDVAAVSTADSTAVDMNETVSATDTTAVVSATKESTTVTLPSGKTINAYKGGVEDQLVNFLKSDEYKNATEDQLKDKWFDFDNLNFEFGTTKITKESQVQVDNLKAILAEFPDAKAKIGAYTDKVGKDDANLKLSQARAEAVKTAVGSAQIVEAKGYGEQFAKVAESASDKEREADRKTAIRLTK